MKKIKKQRYKRFDKQHWIELYGEKEGLEKFLEFKAENNKHMKMLSEKRLDSLDSGKKN